VANPTCTRDEFVSKFACYKNLDAQERQALKLYLNVLELAAIGGTDYTAELGPGGDLNADAIEFNRMTSLELELSELVVAANNATSAGATVSSDIQELANAIKCLKNFDMRTLANMQLLVDCQLGVHKAYPQ
jgi:hypothetical protein